MTQKLNNVYHISFSYMPDNKKNGTRMGRATMNLAVIPDRHEHLVAIEQFIAQQYKIKDVVLMHWSLLRTEIIETPKEETITE